MTTAQPSPDGVLAATAELPPMGQGAAEVEMAGPQELNQWKRGFTPQAEIWNGRLAMLGLSVGLSVLLIGHLASR